MLPFIKQHTRLWDDDVLGTTINGLRLAHFAHSAAHGIVSILSMMLILIAKNFAN